MSKKHTVAEGDCISSIAYANGFSVDGLWSCADNAALRTRRTSPYQLVPGDVVTIPDPRPRVITCAAGKTHKFRRKDVPERLRLQLLDEDDQARASLSYVLDVDGKRTNGTSDGDGWVEEWISPAAKSATLELDDEIVDLSVGALPPVSEDRGVIARLAGLGFLADEREAEVPRRLEKALVAFQRAQALAESGKIDDATRQGLERAFGS